MFVLFTTKECLYTHVSTVVGAAGCVPVAAHRIQPRVVGLRINFAENSDDSFAICASYIASLRPNPLSSLSYSTTGLRFADFTGIHASMVPTVPAVVSLPIANEWRRQIWTDIS